MSSLQQAELDLGFPHANNGLFSNHYLDELLPANQRAWDSISPSELRQIYDCAKAILDDYGVEGLREMDESSLEEHFIRPLLRLLGWKDCFDVQIGSKVFGTVTQIPDYAFFPSHEDLKAANPFQQSAPERYYAYSCAIGDAKAWDVDLDRHTTGESRRYNPSFQINRYLRDSEVQWGILTSGRLWRLYHRSRRNDLTVFYEVDLLRHLEREFDPQAFRYFALFFALSSFLPLDPGQSALLDLALKGSADYTRDVEGNLKRRAYDVVETLTAGLIEANPELAAEPQKHLEDAHHAALVLLYRLLFILYAEARGLLPLATNRDYLMRYSLDALKRDIKDRHDQQIRAIGSSTDVFNRLRSLFSHIETGNEQLGVFAYNGGLFERGRTPLLDDRDTGIGDEKIEKAILLLTTDEAPGGGYGDFIDFRSLSVRHLGSIYEGLLELKPAWAAEEMAVIVGRNKAEFFLPARIADADPAKYTPLLEGAGRERKPKRIPPGNVYLRNDRGERKSTGTYYTPDPIVRHIVETTLAPLCDGRTREEILQLKVLDPAMGSAHFLVGAVDYLALRIMEAEPEPEGGEGAAIESADSARRIVVERCIYGVDLSPLAVELAKLSLWLHTIKQDRALNFLDHHLKCGNSLIGESVDRLGTETGTRRSKKKKLEDEFGQANIILEKLTSRLTNVLDMRRQIELMPSRTADQVAQKKRLMERSDEGLERFKLLADLQSALHFGVEDPLKSLTASATELENAAYWQGIENQEPFASAALQQRSHRFFHWELEFPELFFDHFGRPLDSDSAGFDAVIGNPPWDIIKPQSRWFFIAYDPAFWDLGKQQAIKRIKLLCKDENINAEWEDYQRTHKFLSKYYKGGDYYSLQFRGDINLYKLFSEQAFGLVRKGGYWGFVLPSGIYTDLGSYKLRKYLFDNSDIDYLYCFENRGKKIFPDVHASYKIVMIKAEKGGKTRSFKARFMMHDLDVLDGIDEIALEMPVKSVRRFSPGSLSIMEFNSQRDVDITAKIYGDHPLLGEKIEGTWNVEFTTEFHMTNDSHLFNEVGWGLPLYEGRMVGQFDVHAKYYQEGFGRTSIWPYLPSGREEMWKPQYWVSEDHLGDIMGDGYKTAVCDILGQTNYRSLLCALVRASYPCGNTINVLNVNPHSNKTSLLLTVLVNSFVIDFVFRFKVKLHANKFLLLSIPIIRDVPSPISRELMPRAMILTCLNKDFAPLWEEFFSEEWNLMNLKEIDLSQEWRPEYGANDFIDGRRDGPERAKLRAEIDALIAHLYGLERDEFAYILDTFPVLKKYDERDFGFFRSKEWALQAYDHFAPQAAQWRRNGEI